MWIHFGSDFFKVGQPRVHGLYMSPGNLSHIFSPVNAGRKIQEGVSHVVELLEIVMGGLRGWVVESESDMARWTTIVRTQPYVVCHHRSNLAPKIYIGNFVHLGKNRHV